MKTLVIFFFLIFLHRSLYSLEINRSSLSGVDLEFKELILKEKFAYQFKDPIGIFLKNIEKIKNKGIVYDCLDIFSNIMSNDIKMLSSLSNDSNCIGYFERFVSSDYTFDFRILNLKKFKKCKNRG